MSLKDKLMFWKKNDDFDFDRISDDPLNSNLSEQKNKDILGSSSNPTTDPFAQVQDQANLNSPPSYNPNNHSPNQLSNSTTTNSNSISRREIELLNSKLDTIKSLLASLDQRLGVIEQVSRTQQAKVQERQQPKNHLW